jgi:hypothetical protein
MLLMGSFHLTGSMRFPAFEQPESRTLSPILTSSWMEDLQDLAEDLKKIEEQLQARHTCPLYPLQLSVYLKPDAALVALLQDLRMMLPESQGLIRNTGSKPAPAPRPRTRRQPAFGEKVNVVTNQCKAASSRR